jgi:hypothetical protein
MHKPDGSGLQWTHRELGRHDLGPWQMLSWRYKGKPLGVGWRLLILLLCVVCVTGFLVTVVQIHCLAFPLTNKSRKYDPVYNLGPHLSWVCRQYDGNRSVTCQNVAKLGSTCVSVLTQKVPRHKNFASKITNKL